MPAILYSRNCSRDANLQKRRLASAKRNPLAAVRIKPEYDAGDAQNSLNDTWFLARGKKNPGTTSPFGSLGLAGRD
jgi:hypothetical protein